MHLSSIYKKIELKERISTEEGTFLLQTSELLDLGALAVNVRHDKNPPTPSGKSRVTFVVDTNPNYTNICHIDCTFCAFYRHAGEKESYVHTVDEMIENFRVAASRGATTILLQGGVNPAIPFEYYLELVRRTVRELPNVIPHFYSTSEIVGMSQVSGLTIKDVLQELWGAGQRTIPGGGAEILCDRVKRRISHRKGTSSDWLDVMRQAHIIGFKTTATMMYGHIETDEDIVAHLEAIRQLQDEHHGFTAFIPWSFKPSNTPLQKIVTHHAGPLRYLQLIALARIYLDNFDHVQASWFSEGKKTGQIALYFGADDFGGTLIEENVHAAADFINRTDEKEVIRLIEEAGFIAAQRTTLYQILKVCGV